MSIYVGSKNTNCLIETPKNINLELNPLNVNVTGAFGAIAGGVAKGFSAANYLTLPEKTPSDIVNGKMEFGGKFSLTSKVTSNSVIFEVSTTSWTGFNIAIDSSSRLRLWTNSAKSITGSTLDANIDYWFRCVLEQGSCTIYLSTDGETYIQDITTTSIGTPTSDDGSWVGSFVSIGIRYYNKTEPFTKGSIDLAQSYIKINNELWWSGDSYTKVGSWIDNGVVGSFTDSFYLTLPNSFDVTNGSTWEKVFKFTTGSNVTTQQSVIGCVTASKGSIVQINAATFRLYLSSASSWDIASNVSGTYSVQPNTDYYIKLEFTGTEYNLYYSLDGKEYILDITIANTKAISLDAMKIGDTQASSQHFQGTIDLTQSYINIDGERWWQGGNGDVTLKQGSKVFVPNGWSDYDYYKYVYQDWTQPVLTANGTMGGDSFAVSASNTHQTEYGYLAFDGKDSTQFTNSGNKGSLTFYNPLPLKIFNLHIMNGCTSGYVRPISSGTVSGSNDNNEWTVLKEFTNTLTGLKAEWDIDLSDNENGYKYYKIDVVGDGSYARITELTITAQEGIPVLSTSDDYDVKIPKGYKVFNELVIPNNISAQSFANSEQVVCYNSTTNRLCFVGNDVYDTVNNIMSDNCPLPVARCTADNFSVTSIDETFDWCGRIGNTVFVLPGVKGFIAKGYTNTGTYDSTEFTVNKVLTADVSDVVTDRDLLLNDSCIGFVDCIYNKENNLLYNTDGDIVKAVQFGKINSDDTQITSLTTYTLQPTTTVIKIEDIAEHGVYVGSKNTNCLTYTPKHVDIELNPLNVNVTGTWGAIADGVAKGFSTGNWLSLPEVFNPESNPWEIVIKAKTPSAFSKRNWLTGGGKATGKDFDFVSMGLESNGKPLLYITSNGTSWNIASAAVSSNTLVVNTDYLFRCQFTGTQYIYSTSVDNGSTWVTQITIDSTTNIFVPTTPQAIGTTCYQANAPQFWEGSIDLTQSYININGERWWSGDSYTKVGSWIESGVAGSFTTANYLTLTEVLPLSTSSNVETVIKAKTSSATGSQVIIANTTDAPSGGGFVVRTDSGSRLYCWGTTNNSSWSITKADTGIDLTTEDKYIKIIYTPTLMSFSESIDGVTWNDGQSITIAGFSDTTPRLGLSGTKYPFLGSIDLTQSYIKVNNEIWWQGGNGDVTLKQGSKVFVPNGWSDYDYYKYVYQDWTQPVLTENGVLGGESFAVASLIKGRDTTHEIFTAFDGNTSNGYMTAHNTTNPQWVTFYNPNPLIVKSLKVYQYTGERYYYINTLIVQGSNDNVNWEDLTTKPNSGYVSDFTIDLSSNDTGYKYYRLYITGRSWYDGSNNYLIINEIEITAQEGIPNPTTSDDYDVKIPKGYKVFNELVIPNDISTQSFANSEQAICYNPATNRLCLVDNDVYDTANNVMSDNCSLPVARCTANNTSITSINQIFNDFGYIGNTAFVLPDVKGFIAKGYTNTGTYDSTEFTTNKVLTADLDAVTDRSLLLNADKLDYIEGHYNKVDNLLYNTDGEVINAIECGKVTSDGIAITSLTPYTAQPLTTTINIKAIYSGSQLVYLYQPYEPATVILYGANTGTKTYELEAGLYQCCVVGGGWRNQSNWSRAGGAAVEIQFRLTTKTTVVIYSGGLGATAYLNIDGVRVATANTASGQNGGGSYSIDTASPYYVSTIVARNGGGANLSTAGSVSPYGGWGAGNAAGGARLAYVSA